MRVLLIDNHDSFTFNVAHDIAAVVGVLPEVTLNDAPPVAPSQVDQWLAGFDAIVVSPGPGTPECPADLGISAAAIAQREVPVLGICLGMQAMGHALGVPVIRAPRPVHGEIAQVEHCGGGLFEGLDSPLPMVRYHSLALDPAATTACPCLVVDARSEGVVMAVHRVDAPQWGVQTHPESICSTGGRQILANFFAAATRWNQARGRAGLPLPATAHGAAPVASPGPIWRLLCQQVRTAASAESVFDAVFGRQRWAFWLDSASGQGMSVCGAAAGPLARIAQDAPGGVRLRDEGGTRFVAGRDLLDLVEASIGDVVPAGVDGMAVDSVPFVPGWVGHLDYEYTCRGLFAPTEAPASMPGASATLVLGDRVLVLAEDAAWVMALSDGTEACEEAQLAWIRSTVALVNAMPPAAPGLCPGAPPVLDVSIRHGKRQYVQLIAECQGLIRAGESYELCLTNQITARTTADPWDLYRRLRAVAPRPFGAYLAFEEVQVLSASPERFLSVSREGIVEAKPIKGTRPRGRTSAEDTALALELGSSVKERAENLMIVDLLRHDLSRVCAPSTVHVPVLFDVETHAGVHQLVSTIRGRLAPGRGPVDAVRAALPGGSMTGAPKERSVEILRDIEAGARGIYSGVIGYFSLDGALDLSIVIRTVVHHGNHVTYGVGGAITARSEPEAEWAETMVKARTLGDLLGIDIEDHL